MTAGESELLDGPLSTLAQAVSSGALSARAVAQASLARAEKARDLFGAFLSIDVEAALRQAETSTGAPPRARACRLRGSLSP